ncbi:MAG: geranylgeranylglycerol-phosphate geranylgeranyltransferase [Ignavibacterium sp.]|uniref:geranylgeranylglycerol-phosphate geranylgeranyltransferase n=1 Tax=Ignavibacterium sp. TaxID=2651167 RepID=UPI00404991A3
MKRFFYYIKLTRPLNSLITALVVLVGGVISSFQNSIEINLILASVAASIVAASGNVINDMFDIEIDKIAHPERPLASGKLKTIEAKYFYIVLIIISISISLILTNHLLIITVFAISLLFLYSFILKKIPLVGNIVIALLTALAFLFGGVAVDNFSGAIIPAIFAFLINLIRELVKDAEDYEGDKTYSVNTFPIKFGMKRTKKLVLAVSIVLIAFTFYPFVESIYKIEYFVVVMAIVNPILLYSLKKLFENDDKKSFKQISSILKLDMIFGLIAIYLGK